MNKISFQGVRNNLRKIENINETERDAIIHALVDSYESFERVYRTILPQMTDDGISKEQFQDLLWEVREEFRHIDYHIHDGGLLDL